jgi:hypothetical protein
MNLRIPHAVGHAPAHGDGIEHCLVGGVRWPLHHGEHHQQIDDGAETEKWGAAKQLSANEFPATHTHLRTLINGPNINEHTASAQPNAHMT